MAHAASTSYGAFELKRSYQKNMLMGTGFAAFLTAFLIFSVWLYNVITYDEMEVKNVIRIKTIADLGAPPSLQAKPPQIDIAKRVFSPDPAEVAFAKKIVDAMPDGAGAVMIDGKMQDDATWKQAKVLLDLARLVAAKAARTR